MDRSFRIPVAALLALLLLPVAVRGEGKTPSPTYTTVVDWAANKITVDATLDLSGLGAVLPNAKARGEQIIKNDVPSMTQSALYPIVADSFHTVGELAVSSPARLTGLNGVMSARHEEYAKLSSDLKRLTMRYVFPIFPDLAALFVDQVHANPPRRLLSFVPTTRFSGIIIYAQGKLPVHGENGSAALVPCLFPRIWDENMTLLASANTIDPNALRKWGVAAYAPSTDEKPYTGRIGLNPYHTIATGVFGKHYTDVIISNEAASRILASKDNIQLLEEGRVLIIADPGGVTGGE